MEVAAHAEPIAQWKSAGDEPTALPDTNSVHETGVADLQPLCHIWADAIFQR